MTADFYGYAYAAAVASGGIFGYWKAGSIPSLCAGLVFGTALALGAFNASQNPPMYTIQLCTTSALAGIMGYRYYLTGKFMPGGMICAVSLLMLGKIGLQASGILGPVHKTP